MVTKIDCKSIADRILDEVQEKIEKHCIIPGLTVISVGDDGASASYRKKIKSYCDRLGVSFTDKNLRWDYDGEEGYEGQTEDELKLLESRLIQKIREANDDYLCDGIMVQTPLPRGINVDRVLNEIDPLKDVDGQTSANMGKLACHSDFYFVPCTAQAVIDILKEEEKGYKDLHRLDIALFGRSNTVGKPLALELMNQNATVNIAHSRSTQSPLGYTFNKNVVISAIGVPHHFGWDDLDERYTKIIIDCGVSLVNGKLQGDFDLDDINNDDEYNVRATTVPGGVGVITTAELMKNVVEATIRRFK